MNPKPPRIAIPAALVALDILVARIFLRPLAGDELARHLLRATDAGGRPISGAAPPRRSAGAGANASGPRGGKRRGARGAGRPRAPANR